ncbi:MAG TPA: glycoside hydrolase family 15 protein [Acidothermaceae bacterium]
MAGALSKFAAPPDRVGGYLPLRGYALVGDSRTCALSSSDGSIDWWSVPTMASPPVFGRLLDSQRGGHFAIRPAGQFEVARRYADDEASPETVFRTSSGVVRVIDTIVELDATAPQAALVRRVIGVEGEVAMNWDVVVGDRFADDEVSAQARSLDGVGWVVAGDVRLAVVTSNAGVMTAADQGFAGVFDCRAGEEALVAVVSAEQWAPTLDVVANRVREGGRAWASWSRGVRYRGPWSDAVRRSAVVLKQLTYQPTGALQAAATTSLPECLGADLNYDYRFTWVRDTGFAIDAMTTIGMDVEVAAVLRCLLDEVRVTAPEVKVLYTIEGATVDGRDSEAPGWEGYRGSKPVRVGNEAANQRQLGVAGDLIDAVWRYVRHGNTLEADDAAMIADIADETCGQWAKDDSGIWELDEHRPYTVSKMACWTALDRATKLARDGHLPADRADQWQQTAAEIRRYVNESCWSEAKRSYTMFAGGDLLDCSVLLAARTGFCELDVARLSSTADAVRRELAAGGPLLYRYSGVQGDEGAFVACSFWLVEALAHLGRVAEAREVMDGMVALANDVGLYSEQIDPTTLEFLGNLPQALSHLALIGAASAVAAAEQRRDAADALRPSRRG